MADPIRHLTGAIAGKLAPEPFPDNPRDAEIARLRDALNGLLDWVEIDRLPMDRDALHIAYTAAGRRPKPQ
jgi:hypothetical protein